MFPPRRKKACRAGGRRLLADAAQIETGVPQGCDRPLERRRYRDHMVELGDAVGMLRTLTWRRAIGPGRR
jgi:hypothetical protein